MGAGWPVWCGVGVGRCRGVGRLADGEAAGRRAGLEVAGAGCREPPAGIRDGGGTAGCWPEGDAPGEAAGPAGDGAERAAEPGAGAPVASALWPPSTTASAIATPAAASAPASTTAPERKLISSMRA